jgi:hypothetical protein
MVLLDEYIVDRWVNYGEVVSFKSRCGCGFEQKSLIISRADLYGYRIIGRPNPESHLKAI